MKNIVGRKCAARIIQFVNKIKIFTTGLKGAVWGCPRCLGRGWVGDPIDCSWSIPCVCYDGRSLCKPSDIETGHPPDETI